MLVRADEDDSHTAFQYRELAAWIEYKEVSGEIITDDSWVMRELWDPQTIPKKTNFRRRQTTDGVLFVSKSII